MKKISLTLIVGLVAAVTIFAVGNAAATTAPAIQISINVSLTDTSIKLSRYDARRGWGAVFTVRNLGKKPHSFDIGGLQTKVIQPGSIGRVGAAFEERGKFPFKVVLNSAGTTHAGVFTVR